MSHVACQLSLTSTATAKDPSPANSLLSTVEWFAKQEKKQMCSKHKDHQNKEEEEQNWVMAGQY